MVQASSALLALAFSISLVSAACPGNLRARYTLNVPSGWQAETVLGSLTSPRGIAIDTVGNLLVVERGKGVTGHALDANGCVTSTKTVISNSGLNHGIDVSADGKTLFASSVDILYSWTYDPATMTATGQKTLVTGMNHQDHITRTVLHYGKDPNYIILSRGSNDNLDMQAYASTTGRAIIKSFDLRTLASGSVNYASGGQVMAYGLRNDVGIAEDKAGNIISVENSSDDMKRTVNGQSTDVHQNNPGEPVYNVGTPDAPLGFWGGYPYCFYVWDPTLFRDKTFKVGDNFVQSPNNTVNDAWCESKVTKPMLLLPPHTAPMDIKFGRNDTNAYVSLHGSWDRQPPSGYKVVIIPGQYSETGAWSPKSPITASQTATTDLLWNNDASRCQTGCFRPVGLAFDLTGKFLYVASDQSNEVFVLRRT